MKIFKYIFLIVISFGGLKTTYAQDDKEKLIRLLFIFDGSNSMNAQWQKSSKIEVAKRLLTHTLDSLKGLDNIEVALRMYGHQTRIIPGQQDCSDTKLEVPFAPGDKNIDRIKDKIRSLEPKGTTPIARSLEYSAGDFPECDNCRNVIILITDGIEACDEDPCAVARALRAKGIKLKPFIIGVGLDTSYLDQFNCIGEFLSAETEASFQSVLKFVVSQALNNTTVQVNLLDTHKKPKETDVTMSFYNQKSGQLIYTYMHTINRLQVPDTLALDPLYTYKLVVHTTPEVIKENIKITPGKHNIIELDAPQGILDLRIQGSSNPYSGIRCIVRKEGDMNTVNVQDFNHTHKYIVGNYDLEILTLPRLYMKNVKIEQSRHSEITIPQSGMVSINKGKGPAAIFELKDGIEKWVCNLSEEGTVQNFNLLPGKYKVVYRFERSMSTAHTITEMFKIIPNKTENITL